MVHHGDGDDSGQHSHAGSAEPRHRQRPGGGAGGELHLQLTDGYTYTSGCEITNVTPASGEITGGTTVTILGDRFDSSANVRFGDSFYKSVKRS